MFLRYSYVILYDIKTMTFTFIRSTLMPTNLEIKFSIYLLYLGE